MIGELAAISAAFCWALSAVLYKNALQKVSYFVVNLVRSSFAVLFLLLTLPFVFYQSSVLVPNEYLILALGAITNLVIGDTFYFIGLKKIGVSEAQPISYSYPLFVMFLAALVLGEPLTSSVLVGTPLIAVGVILISLEKNSRERKPSKDSTRTKGMVASLVAALFWSIGLTCYKWALLNHEMNDPALSTFVTAFRTTVMLPFLVLMFVAGRGSRQIRKLSKIDFALLAVAGILALAVGGILLFTSYQLINANIATPLSSTSPFFSLILARQYAGEKATYRIILGTIFIVFGVALVSIIALL
jgi:DME family drug/metabolite transporter